jgi:hypothetical protein
MMTALAKRGVHVWPKEVKQRLRIPFMECRVVAGKVYFKDRLVIGPNDTNIQLQLIHWTYASRPGGHPGRVKTLDLMNRKYWRPRMCIPVRTYCTACLLHDKLKTPKSLPAGFLKSLAVPLTPW